MRTLGLRTKLVLTFTGLFLAFTAVFAWYLIERQGTIASQALETRAVGLSGVLAKLVRAAAATFGLEADVDHRRGARDGARDHVGVVVERPQVQRVDDECHGQMTLTSGAAACSAKRSRRNSETSMPGLPSTIHSAINCPTAGACMKP